jgi:hypothetical protein
MIVQDVVKSFGLHNISVYAIGDLLGLVLEEVVSFSLRGVNPSDEEEELVVKLVVLS